MTSWHDYWNRDNKIYVSERHLRAYYEVLGRDVLGLVPEKRPLTLLDWGCGEALLAPTLSDAGISVQLYDPVPRAFERARARYEGAHGISVLDDASFALLPKASVDAILVHSVLQYLAKPELEKALARFRELSAPGGLLILGDVVPPDISMVDDASDLLGAGLRHGFFLDALFGLAATLFSDYRSVRKENGFSTYGADELIALLAQHGFEAERAPRNIGLSGHRMLIRGHRSRD